MIETAFRPMVTARSIQRTLLALLMLSGVVLFTLSSDPAEAATTFTVTETGDDADLDITDDRCDTEDATGRQCTLRAAIEQANETTGADTIDFDIVDGTNSYKIISPDSELPTIRDSVTIDGYTQADASPNTLDEGNDADLKILLDGVDAGSVVPGLRIDASGCTIKGLVIRNFSDYGIFILGETNNTVEGNFIGVGRDGETDRGNSDGVFVQGESTVIGGTDPESRNVISGNDGTGVFIGTVAEENRIEGNYIGTTADGTADLGNLYNGVYVAGESNTVGGTSEGARNVISGNDGSGVFISSTVATENRVEGNYIGTETEGTGDLGNTEDGVSITSGAFFNIVGGVVGGAGNRIAHNGGDGVSVSASSSTGNFLLGNSVFSNGGLGIDLAGGTENASGVTANDTDDADTGPNDLQNFPVIRSAVRSSATGLTTISGRLNSTPAQLFEVQCFLTNGASPSAHGEGRRLLGTDIVSTGAGGNTRFSCVSSLAKLGQVPGQTVSATATELLITGTSEFSKNEAITVGP